MDFANLFKQFNSSEKDMLTCFIIQLPLCFTLLYLYIPEFKDIEMYYQFIFSATMGIGCVYISFIAHSIALLKTNTKINKTMLLFPNLSATIFLFCIIYLINFGIVSVAAVIIVFNAIFAVIFRKAFTQ